MSFIVILICLGTQWFLNLTSVPYQRQWAIAYIAWMRQKFSIVAQGHPLFGVLLLVLPIVIIASLIFTVIYHLLGHVGYLIVSLVLLWYSVDITFLKKSSTPLSAALFLESYQKLFAPLFWYFVFGPVGLVLYITVATLCTHLPTEKYMGLTLGVLDWIPIRVVGLTFALAGNFGAVFKMWSQDIFQNITDNQNQVVSYGEAALSVDSTALSLVHRALFIWLGIMALITVAHWLG
jgi:AmpE protein